MDKIIVGYKGKERWYPKYAPHIILGTNISVIDYFEVCEKYKKYKKFKLRKEKINRIYKNK